MDSEDSIIICGYPPKFYHSNPDIVTFGCVSIQKSTIKDLIKVAEKTKFTIMIGDNVEYIFVEKLQKILDRFNEQK